MKKSSLLFAFIALLVINTQAQTVTDINGHVYNIVTIGTQVWMKENLKATKLKDGTDIPLVTNDMTWAYLTGPAYCWYANNQTTYGDTYGALYNWYTVKTSKLCPAGWHVPKDAEWTTLSNYLGGLSVAGGKLKEAGTVHWSTPNTGATNESGFTALPGGIRLDDGTFSANIFQGEFWSSDSVSNALAHARALSYSSNSINSSYNGTTQGLSVRCICNYGAQINEFNSDFTFEIFPNPASQTLTISGKTEITQLIITDMLGNVVIQQQPHEHAASIDVGGLANGIYFIKAVIDKGFVVRKFVKE